jgi:BMFP domain-containing protein YqiC
MSEPKASRSIRPVFARRALSRRGFLRGMGVAMALPMLDSMLPALASAAEQKALAAAGPDGKPRRMLGICNNLGLVPDQFFPTTAGRNYALSPYLKHLEAHRDAFTVFSGVWHPDVDGGHPADNCFLTAAPHPGSGGFRNTISLDQHMAEYIGHLTRFPSLTLGVNVNRGQRSLSWTASGVMIPCEEKASDVFKRMFVQGSAKEVQDQVRKLELGRSILDAVSDQAKDLQRSVPSRDRDRLDQYFTSVREMEKRLAMSKEWENKPKPKVSAPCPLDPESPREYMDKVKLMYDMARLAFETDSTRCITLMLDSVNSPVIDVEGEKISEGYHNLSHHGKNAEKLKQLKAIDEWHMKLLAGLIGDLKGVKEGGDTLIDRTMIVYGSNLGNANTHVTTNLPVLFAGGGFKHGQHLAFDKEHNYPLPNLFVSMLQRMGIESDKFASSTGTMRGLETA